MYSDKNNVQLIAYAVFVKRQCWVFMQHIFYTLWFLFWQVVALKPLTKYILNISY